MTLADRLTVARIFLAGVFLVFLLPESVWARSFAFVLYAVATATDWLDGWLARRTRTTSPFGALADPLADKLLVLAALAAFLEIRGLDIPSWIVFLVVGREFVIATLRSLAALQGVVLKADRYGKWKMGVQSGCILAILALLIVRTYLHARPEALPLRTKEEVLAYMQPIPRLLSYLMLAATLTSGGVYMARNWGMLRRALDHHPA